MFVLTVNGKEDDGAYSVANEDGDRVIYLFDEEDDATRYAMMLEVEDSPSMKVVEIDPDMMVKACEFSSTRYAIIGKNDIVIPPQTPFHDNV
jgi:hypothetical protein